MRERVAEIESKKTRQTYTHDTHRKKRKKNEEEKGEDNHSRSIYVSNLLLFLYIYICMYYKFYTEAAAGEANLARPLPTISLRERDYFSRSLWYIDIEIDISTRNNTLKKNF